MAELRLTAAETEAKADMEAQELLVLLELAEAAALAAWKPALAMARLMFSISAMMATAAAAAWPSECT